MKNQGVTARSTCAWNPFPVYHSVGNINCGDVGGTAFSNTRCIPWNSYAVTPPGYCALVGPPNPTYRQDNCKNAARIGVTGYFGVKTPPWTIEPSFWGSTCFDTSTPSNSACFRCESQGGFDFYVNTLNCYKGHDFYMNLNFQNRDTPNTGAVSPSMHRICLDNEDDDGDGDDVTFSCKHDTFSRTQFLFLFYASSSLLCRLPGCTPISAPGASSRRLHYSQMGLPTVLTHR